MRGVLLLIPLICCVAGAASGQGETAGPEAPPPAEYVVEGTVTLVDSRRHLVVIQDRGRAKAVTLDAPPPPLQVGERVALAGTPEWPAGAATGDPAVDVALALHGVRVSHLGEGDPLSPRHIRIDRDWISERNFLWVEVDGTVTFVAVDEGVLTLELSESDVRSTTPAARMTVHVFGWGDRSTATLPNRRVRVAGVCEQVMNPRGEATAGLLWAQTPAQLGMVDVANRDWRDLQIQSVSGLTPANSNLSWGRKVLVRGVVTGSDTTSGAWLVQDDGRAGVGSPQTTADALQPPTLLAHVSGGEDPPVGQPIELVGILEWRNGTPVLLHAYERPRRREAVAGSSSRPPGQPREYAIADLSSDIRESQAPVGEICRIRCVVTFHDRVAGRDLLFLQDDTGGALASAPPSSTRFAAGQLLLADVVSQPDRLDLVAAMVVGPGAMPRPLAFPDRLSAAKSEGLWVEASGVVRSVGDGVVNVMEKESLLAVRIGGATAMNRLEQLVDSLVVVRGVFTLQLATRPTLLVPSAQYIQIVEGAPGDPFVVPSVSIAELRAWEPNPQTLHRVKVAGVVTFCDGRLLCVQDDSGGIRVVLDADGSLAVGERVEVVGFLASGGGSPTLANAFTRWITPGRLPEPVALSIDDVLAGRLDATLVQLEGVVIDQKVRAGRSLLELQAGQRAFTAVLAGTGGGLPALRAGSRVRITGVNQLQFTNRDQVVNGMFNPIPATMGVLLRSPADVVLLQRPPWWNWRHTVGVVATLAAVLGGALVWIRTLRRRVEERTRELRQTMGRLRQETATSATLAERDRLAAEIHDTLEQGLSGIMMQLDGVDSRLKSDPEGAYSSLEMARRMVHFSRSEVRHSLWNLESALLEDRNLGGALTEIARQMSAGNAVPVSVVITGEPQPLPPAVEHHLLRCAQESLTNALKHAGAKAITIELHYLASSVQLTVSDDGDGFVPEAVLTEAGKSLGLRSLRSRSRKIKGQLDIASSPGQGTIIRLTVPLPARSETHHPPSETP